ncbi:MAG TPA: pyrroloquinoline quinone-dependent dehydrogenase [Gammaproteobacteria bacterium]|jgi:quinoprotein glucose dehydrogenase|nr:pyrroloquinoline quinone-dependent dehydrogenase [Gammaproteobacteria bacterium]MDP7296989.1 pyrroloquinoline quinone-dependent dehydrogenase [Gammaproteobacteria bacterium]MDP7660672.1 pyrroloquinoline quinone-dependent dehydrogenase [Gammaproteobacteria bacterium]HJP38962.1 pyrroloquinoline quinone-dependent dehydrogenase [Gammaproteobacteria bacterium]
MQTWIALTGLVLTSAVAQDWPDHGGDRGGSRFSPLTHINRDNIQQLKPAWVFRTGNGQGPMQLGGSYGLQATPILLPATAGGHLVFCDAFNRVFALDPATGAERWRYDPEIARKDRNAQFKCRGIAQWTDQKAGPGTDCTVRIFLATLDQRLIALDALTGNPCLTFGQQGVIELVPFIDRTPPATDTPSVRTYMPPAIVGDTVIVGSSVGAKFRQANAPSGAVRAFAAQDGQLRWQFDPVPRNPNDPQAENWDAEALINTGGGNVWSLMSVDEKRDLVFLPTSSASPNYYGGTRPGDNRYANSIVALRGKTGKVVWHYQLVHHDVWDWDLASQPMLVEIRRDDELIPIVIQLTKQGLVFAFHRETGKPLFPIEERPVTTDGVEGDLLSPTQPFPTAPPPLVQTGLTTDDAWGFTFYDKNYCRQKIDSLRHGELFTPPTKRGTAIRPGMVSNWGTGAFDGSRNLLITNAQNIPGFIRLVPNEEVNPQTAKLPMAGIPGGPPGYIKGTPYAIERGVPQLFSPFGAPCTKPPWYSLVAIDMQAGKIMWSVALGTLDKLIPLPLPLKYGAPGIGGPIATAGGLIFIGATSDEKFRAFDIDNGTQLWQWELPTAAMATPMTYETDGRQFVVVAAGGHHAYYRQKVADYLIAFALEAN